VPIAADLARAAVLAVTGALSLAGVLEIWHLVAFAVIYGAGEAFFGPAFGALVPEIVAPHHRVEANSLDQLVCQAAERLLGPAVGGLVVAGVGAYAVGTALWQFMAFAVLFGACETAGMVVWGTLMSSRVPPELRGRGHSLDWFVSIGLTPVSFALTGPVSKAIGVDATLVAAGVAPMLVCVVLYLVAGPRRDEELHPLLPAAVAS
jgi:MFS family permease